MFNIYIYGVSYIYIIYIYKVYIVISLLYYILYSIIYLFIFFSDSLWYSAAGEFNFLAVSPEVYWYKTLELEDKESSVQLNPPSISGRIVLLTFLKLTFYTCTIVHVVHDSVGGVSLVHSQLD